MRSLTLPLILAVLFLASGCSTGRWVTSELKRSQRSETYLEFREENGATVPQGFDHPAAIDRGKLSAVLEALRYLDPKFLGGHDEIPLFTSTDAALMARDLSNALAEAGPDQRVLFVSRNRRGGFILPSWRFTRGVVFAEEGGKLNIAFSCINQDPNPGDLDIMERDRYKKDPLRIAFTTTPLMEMPWLSIKQNAATNEARPLWAVVDLNAAPDGAAKVEEKVGTAETKPAENRSESLKSKLQLLKELKEDCLISEEEYVKMKARLLDSL